MLPIVNEGRSAIWTRRDFLRVGGGFALAGFSLPGLRSLDAADSLAGRTLPGSGPRSCILVYLLGGPPHQDMFDLKPEAPAEIRGPFSPIATNVSGFQVCEHLPFLATMADKYAVIRSVTRRNSNHTPMIYYTLTGRDTARPDQDNDIRPPQREDFPHWGSVMARFLPSPPSLPGFVAVPELAIRSSTRGEYKRARTALRGGNAGFLGAKYDPLSVNGEPGTPDSVPALRLPEDVSPERFERRAALLALLDRTPKSNSDLKLSEATGAMHALRQQALLMTGSASRGRLATFSVEDEPATVRDRYGRHRFGQTMLLARRLAEAHVPMIAIHFNEMTVCDGWDTHSKNFEALQTELLPMLDQSLSALIADLERRGLLDSTMVVCLGEFGRTPKINGNAGRDHWGDCSSALLAGGGIRGGQVLGASDKHAAFPISDPIDPVDIQATIYRCMGLDPRQPMHDELQRPWEISAGKVISQLL